MKRINTLSLLIATLLLSMLGCNKDTPKQVYDVPGIETTISKIQISPLAYDRARVAVKGIVVDIKESKEKGNQVIISDAFQNTQKLSYKDEITEIKPGDLVLVSGIFDRSSKIIIADHMVKIPYKDDE